MLWFAALSACDSLGSAAQQRMRSNAMRLLVRSLPLSKPLTAWLRSHTVSTQLPRSVRDPAAPLQLLLHGSARPSALRQHAIAMAAAVRRGLSAGRVESGQTFATLARLHDVMASSLCLRLCRASLPRVAVGGVRTCVGGGRIGAMLQDARRAARLRAWRRSALTVSCAESTARATVDNLLRQRAVQHKRFASLRFAAYVHSPTVHICAAA